MASEDSARGVFSVTFWTKMSSSTVYSESLPEASDLDKTFLTYFDTSYEKAILKCELYGVILDQSTE
jgi:hypothetical protein